MNQKGLQIAFKCASIPFSPIRNFLKSDEFLKPLTNM